MTDTTPEALDALIAGLHDAARSIEFDSDRDLMTAAADTIAALRAASVAMRERAADAVYRAMTALGGETAKARVEASIREFADEEPFATANWLRDLIRALPLDAPPSADRCCRGLSPEECATVPSRHCDGLQPAPVDPVADAAFDGPVEQEIDRLRLLAFREGTEENRKAYFEACSKWFQDRHYRADAPPTLAEAMMVLEVRALVDALETLHVAATLMADRCGLRDCDEALDESHAALARLKGDTP
jgi:hypothetical protein